MAEIETLTEDERYELLNSATMYDTTSKALRILDAQAKRISELEQQLAKARQRINALEAQVLSSDTVAKSEYQQMVQQRDTMRQERNAARDELEGLRSVLQDVQDELAGASNDPKQDWRLDEACHILRCAGFDAIGYTVIGHCSACEDYPQLGPLRCTNCGRTGADPVA